MSKINIKVSKLILDCIQKVSQRVNNPNLPSEIEIEARPLAKNCRDKGTIFSDHLLDNTIQASRTDWNIMKRFGENMDLGNNSEIVQNLVDNNTYLDKKIKDIPTASSPPSTLASTDDIDSTDTTNTTESEMDNSNENIVLSDANETITSSESSATTTDVETTP